MEKITKLNEKIVLKLLNGIYNKFGIFKPHSFIKEELIICFNKNKDACFIDADLESFYVSVDFEENNFCVRTGNAYSNGMKDIGLFSLSNFEKLDCGRKSVRCRNGIQVWLLQQSFKKYRRYFY